MRWLERWFENGLFAARWLLAPFYAGLAIAMLLLLAVFARELWAAISGIAVLNTEAAIVKLLTLLDLALVASLVVVVVLAGYENFISKIDTEGHEDRPGWMGTTSFGGLKLKLFASIVAISGIQLLKAFMELREGSVETERLWWMAGIHLTFVVTALLSALTDWLSSRGDERAGH